MIPERNTKRPTDKNEGDMLQIWADIDAHLQFAEQVIQKSDLQAHPRTTLLERIQRIRTRQADPYMYLAVVGEFNTGKSTFINALLHEELLQTSAVVATATSTQIRYGTHVDLEVRFRNTKKALSFTQNREQLWRVIQEYSRNIHGNTHDIRTYIEAVTANNAVAAQVDSVVIHHPTSFLTNNIIIIDTPGMNAEYERHRQITSAVVQHEADAAVIIIPAPVPLSQTLTTFLMESLRPYIHRCLFVVTQMDKIPKREHTRLLENIQIRLTKVLGSNQPITLYASAPQVVLDTLHKQPVAAEVAHWYDDFGNLEQMLWDRLRRERALNITESLLRLMTMLFEELGTRLRERQSNYAARQENIQRETIQDISAFTTQQQHTYQILISNAATNARYNITSSIANQSSETEDEIREAIFSADNASNLKSTMERAVKEEMDRASRAFQRELEEQIEMLKHTTARASQTFDTHFAQEYQKLQKLAGTVSFAHMQQSSEDIALNTSSISYSAGKINDELDGTVGILGWGGAAVGAAIGTAILPGLGTLAGLFVGPLLIGIFGPSLQDRKKQVWDTLRPALKTSFQRMETQGLTILNEYESEVQYAFQQRVSTYMQRYKSIVDAMIKEQQKELQMLGNTQRTIQANQQEIERRRTALKQKQQQIAQKKA